MGESTSAVSNRLVGHLVSSSLFLRIIHDFRFNDASCPADHDHLAPDGEPGVAGPNTIRSVAGEMMVNPTYGTFPTKAFPCQMDVRVVRGVRCPFFA